MADSPRSEESTAVLLVLNGTPLRVRGVWEFVPYNDAFVSPKPNKAFENAVNKSRDELLTSGTLKALRALRDVEDKHFTRTSEQRNIITLFLYSGPVRTPNTAIRLTYGYRMHGSPAAAAFSTRVTATWIHRLD